MQFRSSRSAGAAFEGSRMITYRQGSRWKKANRHIINSDKESVCYGSKVAKTDRGKRQMQVGRFFGGIHHVQIIGRQDVGCRIGISTWYWYLTRGTLVVPVAGISTRCPVRGRRSAPPPVLYTSDKPAFSQECIISIPDRIPNFEHRTTRVHAGAIVQ
jgi:hypothetical protein